MAKRGFELNTRITAKDDASKVVDGVAKKVGDLEDEQHVAEIDADGDRAEAEIKALDRRLDGLTKEERVAVLEVQAKQAQREVDQLTRKLANADKYDDDEISLIVDAKDQASKKLAKIRGELEDLQDEADETGSSIRERLGDAFRGLDSKFGGIGGKLGGKLVAGFAAAGVGALMVEALQTSWDKAGGIRKITGQFRLSTDEAARYGKEAGELYAENWGESLPQVQEIVAKVGERLQDVTDETLGAISEQIMAVSETWGAEYGAVIRSVTQLTQNGLAPSSQAALDLIVTGFQDGADEAGDFLDTIDEYSQHWAAMGLSGEDALNQIIAGFQSGQRDADKLADAVKEMRIRAVEDTEAITDAYEDLGLNADETRKKFLEGGDAARDAFLDVLRALKDVEDPVEQNRLAVELIGTQFEDLGPKAIDALLTVRGELRQTEGAAKDLAEQVGEVSPWQDMQRDGERALGAIGDAIAIKFGPSIKAGADALDGLSTGFGLFGDDADDASDKVEASAEVVDYWTERMKLATEEADHHAGLLRGDFTQAQQMVEGAIDDAAQATREKAAADAEAREAAERHLDSIRHFRDEYAALRGELDDRKAWLNLQDTFDETKAKLDDTSASAREQEQAMLDLKDEVLNYAEQINLPDKVVTQLIADIDAGKAAEVELLLARWGNGITLPIRPRVINTGDGSSVYIDEHGNVRHRASGGPTERGGLYEVTEGGRSELLHEGGKTYLMAGRSGRVEPIKNGDAAGSSPAGPLDLSDDTIRKLAAVMMAAAGGAIARNDAALVGQLRQGRRG